MSNPNITNRDTQKILLGKNFFDGGNVAASGADVVLPKGIVVGQIAATLKIIPLEAGAGDGSEIPFGIAHCDVTVVDGTDQDLKFVNKGKVNENLINFSDATTLDTLVGPAGFQRTVRAYLNYLGLILTPSTEMTGVDNQ
jgi:hypothetical protein